MCKTSNVGRPAALAAHRAAQSQFTCGQQGWKVRCQDQDQVSGSGGYQVCVPNIWCRNALQLDARSESDIRIRPISGRYQMAKVEIRSDFPPLGRSGRTSPQAGVLHVKVGTGRAGGQRSKTWSTARWAGMGATDPPQGGRGWRARTTGGAVGIVQPQGWAGAQGHSLPQAGGVTSAWCEP